MIKFNQSILDEVQFMKSNPWSWESPDNPRCVLLISEFLKYINRDCYIRAGGETIMNGGAEQHYQGFQDHLNLMIEEHDSKVLIQSATSTHIPNGFNPLVNLLVWSDDESGNGFRIRNTIGIEDFDISLFPSTEYKIGYDISKYDKQTRGIISSRKFDIFRDILYKKITEFNGISQYHRIDNGLNDQDEFDFSKFENTDYTWQELKDKYKESFVAFVVETYRGPESNTLTDKTMLSFLNGNIPIVLGQKNFVRELEDMGFWVANSDFGFRWGDYWEFGDNRRIENYIDCITKFNSMSDGDIKNYWLVNKDKIQNNYDIVTTLFGYQNGTLKI